MSKRRRFDTRVRASVGPDLYERILREAAARRLTVSQCIRADLEELYAIRDELARPLDVEEPPGGPRRQIVHRLLQDLELRLASSLGRQQTELAELAEAMQRVEAMLDRQYVGLMLYLPDVPEEQHAERAKATLRRYETWRQAVEQELARRRGGQ